MADHLLPQHLLQKLEEKVTMLLIHLDEAHEKNHCLEQEVAQLKNERDLNVGKLKTILDLLDETVKTADNTVVSLNTAQPQREVEVVSSS